MATQTTTVDTWREPSEDYQVNWNTSADIVRSDEEMLQKIKELEEEEMRREQFRKTLADIPPMIFDRSERRSKTLLANRNGLVRNVMEDEKQNRLRNPWSDIEKLIFLEKFLQYPKEFWKIAKFLRNKSTNDVVAFITIRNMKWITKII